MSTTQAAVYEVREMRDPDVFPLGMDPLSTHGSVADAQAAIEREVEEFRASGYGDGTGSYLQRIVVRVEPDGAEHLETGAEENYEW